jgi:ligand-binding sensor domain-containing protein
MIGSNPSYGRDNSDWTTYTSMNWVNDVLPVPDGFWAATEGGVYRYDLKDSTYRTYTNLNGLAGNTVLAIERDASGNLWFGTDGDGLSKWAEGAGIVATYSDFAGDRINDLCAYGDMLFVATAKNGISVFLPEREEIKENYRMLGSLPKDVEVLCVEVIGDRLWAGTSEGVAFADLNQPNLLDPASWNSIRIWNVQAIAHDDSAVYVGTRWGVFQWKEEKFRVAGSFTGQVYDLVAHGTEILAATEEGLFRKHEETWKRYAWFSNEIPVFVARSASPGALWLNVQGIGLTYLRGPRRTHVPPPSGPPGNKFMDLQVDQNGVLWAATSGRDEETKGVYRFDGEHWCQYFTKSVVSVHVDPKGRIWGGTWGSGGFLIEDDGTANTAADAIFELTPDNTPLRPTVNKRWVVVNDFSVDHWGNIWMCNYQAAESLLPPPVTPLVVINDFPVSEQQVFSLSDDGLPTGEINVVTAAPSGLIWFGTRELGFSLLDVGGTPFDKRDDHLLTLSTASHKELTSDNVSDIVVDQEGVLWVATDNGVNAIRGAYSPTGGSFSVESWDCYGREEGLGSAIVHVIVEDAAGNKWFGTEAGLSRLCARDGSIVTYTCANSGLVDDGVRSLAFDARTGELWIGTTRGLSKLAVPASATTPALPEILVSPNPLILSNVNAKITFADLPDDASAVRIFTLSGELVCVLTPESGARSVTWDGGNGARNMVGSGVYFYVVTDSMGRHITGKFAVVR